MSAHFVAVLVVHLLLAGVGAWLMVIDARTHRLPNRIVLPTLGVLVLLVIVEAAATGDGGRALRALIGAVLLGGFFAVTHLASHESVGGGDVKLAAVIGLALAWHGWLTLLLGAAAAFLLGALYALGLMLARRADRRTRIAFGPWMILGAAAAILLS